MGIAIFTGYDDYKEVKKEDDSYATAHGAADGDGRANGSYIVHAYAASEVYPDYYIERSFIHFSTSFLGEKTITAARISLLCGGKVEEDGGHSTVHIVEGVQSIPAVLADFGNHLSKVISGGNITYADLDPDDAPPYIGYPNIITLTSQGRSWINGAGTTKFCYRMAGDIDNTPPTGNNFVDIERQDYLRAVTEAATSVKATTATLNSTLEGIGLEVTYIGADPTYPRIRFQYGLTTGYGGTTDWQYGTAFFESISANLEGLGGGQTYHFRAATEISDGVFSYGSDAQFDTLEEAKYFAWII